ncbi:hypothetical protein ENUP19_0098G0002 [Entamoeba nuttalli]|uniref:Uncharacterized protein n=1 Tax=Entamoeba nuttalli TaxID=412467 RepID=A0ABQ0DH67_9EUKA
MEEETISMTMEEDNNQYNPIEINDNRIYNNYVMSIENEDKDDDKESTRVEARLADEKKRLIEEEKKKLVEEEKKKITKGEKKRLVEKEEENSKKEKKNKRIRRIIEVVKEKEEMKKEIQIKDQTIKN